MTTYYRVLRPVTQADLDAKPAFADVLKVIRPEGRMIAKEFMHLGKDHACKGLAHACRLGILKREYPCKEIVRHASVKFFDTQLDGSGFRHIKDRDNTKEMYMRALYNFDFWLVGRPFPTCKDVMVDGMQTPKNVNVSFADVEEFLRHCNESRYGTKLAQRVIREYLAFLHADGASIHTQNNERGALKSYFEVHDIVLNLPKAKRKHATRGSAYKSIMSIPDFYKILQKGNPSITMRTIMLIKLQSGMDSSTLADRFNYEGYEQIVDYFKTDDHSRWNIDLCPVSIVLDRVKTDVEYTTFLDRDAITQLKEYLAWKEANYGKHDSSQALFTTKQGAPICPAWISRNFSRVAVRAGIQEKISHKLYKIRAHEVRDLLKSTLLAAGCKQYAANHVLGHAPKDSYEKQQLLYPEELLAEYAKASKTLNMFSRMGELLKNIENPDAVRSREEELEEDIKKLEEEKKKQEEKYDKMLGLYKDLDIRYSEIIQKNKDLNRENERLDLKNYNLETKLAALHRKLSNIEEQNANTKDSMEEMVERLIDKKLEKRDGKNPPAGSLAE